eukprot:54651-Eustigmatos_ZCMA.PRE.1
MDKQCKCGKGYVSIWDKKCGKCRTEKEQKDHQYALDCVSEVNPSSQEDAIKFYKEVRSLCK